MSFRGESKTWQEKDWQEEGLRRFGPDQFKWRFKCPSCGRIQTPEEFREFQDKGAGPNTAYQECRGRYTGGQKGPDKCDWAAFGLFSGPHFVTPANGEYKNGDWPGIPVFEFAEER